MGEHYYSPNPTSAHDARTVSYLFRGRTLRFETDAGVFSRQHVDKGTGLLLAALPERFCGRALDLGCGWGAVGVCMASCWPEAQVALTDINERAVALSRKNMAANGLRGCVYCGDGLQNVPGRFHLIATNPPIRAGKAVLYPLFAQAIARLEADGVLYLVIRRQQGAESALKYLRTLADTQVVARGGGYWVLRASAPAG